MSLALEAIATRAVDRAVELLAQATPVGRHYKTDRDFATDADYLIEDDLRELLSRLTPDIGFLGEERGATGDPSSYWCLDPIDGTTNFTRGIPLYGVSLALVQNHRPMLGHIALPTLGERYRTQGIQALMNDEIVSVANTADLKSAIVSVGDFATGPSSAPENRQRVSVLAGLTDRVGRVRMMGSAAADLAWLAVGRVDAVLIHSNHPWDVAAGIALCRAAGATVSHVNGCAYSLDGPDLLAATPLLHKSLTRPSYRT